MMDVDRILNLERFPSTVLSTSRLCLRFQDPGRGYPGRQDAVTKVGGGGEETGTQQGRETGTQQASDPSPSLAYG